MKAWNEFLDKYYPEANRADSSVMYGYNVAQGLVHVLKACGDDLTRANVMKQAASIKNLELGGLLPGVKVNTSADRLCPDLAIAIDEVQGRDVGTASAKFSAATSAASAPGYCLLKKQPLRLCRRGFLL